MKFRKTMVGVILLSMLSQPIAYARPQKTSNTISGVGSANNQTEIDYKPEGILDIQTGTKFQEELPITEKKNTKTGIAVPKEKEDRDGNDLDNIQRDPFSDLYFEDSNYDTLKDENLSWLVENNILARDHNVSLERTGMQILNQLPLFDRNKPMMGMKKSDFLVGLYKANYGSISSRPIMFQTESIRQSGKVTYHLQEIEEDVWVWVEVTGGINKQDISSAGKSDIITSDFIDYWEYRYTPNKGSYDKYRAPIGDIQYYLNSNVYELYLSAMLDKSLIDIDNLADLDFKSQYLGIKKQGSEMNFPEWWNEIPAVTLAGVPIQNGLNYKSLGGTTLGKRYDVTVGGASADIRKRPDYSYFIREDLPVMEALEYVEKFLRQTEEDLTEKEAELISYKYGINYLNNYNEKERKTISFLVAKGIIDFEDPNEFRNLYGSLTEEYGYTLIYRVANKNARRKFHEIQLTDTDKFWIDKGYQNSRYTLMKENDMKGVILQEANDDLLAGEAKTSPVPNVQTASVRMTRDTVGTRGVDEGKDRFISKGSSSNFFANRGENKEWTIIKEFDNLDKYKFAGKRMNKLSEWQSQFSDSIIKFKKLEGNRVEFKVSAPNDVVALAAIDSQIQVATDSIYDDYALKSVTKINRDGTETTLVHQSILQEADSEIVVLEDKVLKNKVTGAQAVLLQDQGMALVGSHIIISDDIMVKTVNGEVYYNLDIIVPLMSNAYMSTVNPFDIYKVKKLYEEQNIPLVAPSGNNIGNVLGIAIRNPLFQGTSLGTKLLDKVLSLKEMVITAVNGDANATTDDLIESIRKSLRYSPEEIKQVEGFNLINLSQSTTGSNHIIRDFKLRTKENKALGFKVLAYWTLDMPSSDLDFENSEVYGSNPTFRDMNDMLSERPKNSRAMAEYWDSNIEISNAIANVMYGTSGVKYIKNGFLTPNLRVMYDDPDMQNREVMYNLLVKIGEELPSKYVETYLGTTYYNESVKGNTGEEINARYNNNDSHYPKKTLPKGFYPMWFHALFNNSGYMAGSAGANFKVTEEPKSGKHTTDLWMFMMQNRTFDSVRSDFIAGGLKFYNFNDRDSFVVTDSNVVYKIEGTHSRIMPGRVEDGKYHLETRTSKSGKDLHSLVGSTIVFEDSSGKRHSFEYNGMVNNNIELIDKTKIVGTPDIWTSAEDVNQLEIDGTIEYPSGRNPTSAAKGISVRYEEIASAFNLTAKSDIIPFRTNSQTRYGKPKDVGDVVLATKSPKGTAKKGGKNETILSRYQNGTKRETLSIDSLTSGQEVTAHIVYHVPYNLFKINENNQLIYNPSNSLLTRGNIYYSSLNKGLIDSIIAKGTNVKKVNQLTDGQTLIFTDIELIKNGEAFYSKPQSDLSRWGGLVTSWNNKDGQYKAVVENFADVIINTSRREVSLAAFISKASLGRIKPGIIPNNTLVGSPTNVNEALVYQKDGSYETYDGGNNSQIPSSVVFSMELDDTLLCRLVDEEKQIYELLYSTNALSDGYLDDIPFFNESLNLDKNDELFHRLDLSKFRVTWMADELKAQFREDFRRLKADNLQGFIKRTLIVLVSLFTFLQWMAYAIINGGLGHGLLYTIRYPSGSSNGRGLDFVRIISCGVHSLDSESVSAGRTFIMTLSMFVLVVVVFRI